jgi:hypothetical protein
MHSPLGGKIAPLIRVDAGYVDDARSRIRELRRQSGKNAQESAKPIHLGRI